MNTLGAFLVPALLAGTLFTPSPEQPSVGDRIYGRVVTAAGDVFEGYIRWDKNEGSWVDLLDGSKELPAEHFREAQRLSGQRPESRRRGFELFGLRVSWDDDDEGGWPSSAQTGIRFGHLRSIEVLSDERALLVLKSGEEVEFRSGNSDIGRGVRGIVVEDPQRGDVELRWIDLELIDFAVAATAPTSDGPERLYGTLTTRWGEEFTGYVAWDQDEILSTDLLDGDDEDGRRRRVSFGEIRAVEHHGPDAAYVILESGEELVLSGTNDVDHRNGGIQISDPGLGQVEVEWEDFSDLTLHAPANGPTYQDFDGGRTLRGTVETEDGRELSGYIRWDNDEEYSWEILNGEYRDIAFDVEFGLVASIEKAGDDRSTVRLLDGRTFELEASNDVDRGNKGIFVMQPDGETEMITWYDFARVTFDHG